MSMQQAPTTDQVRAAWDAIAPGFDAHITPKNLPLSEEILRRIGLQPGARVLDVAAGSGALAIAAARMGADILATDLSPAMLERLAARAADEGLTNVETRVMDAHALDLDDDAFDLTVSMNGVSLLPDLGKGLAEAVRVTRPGGRVAIVGFGPLQKAEFITFFMGAMQAAIPGFTPLPADPPPPPFQVSDPAELRARLTGAGLRDVEVDTITWDMPVESAEQFWDVFTSSNPIGAGVVAELTGEQRAQVKQVLDGMLRERSGGTPDAVLHAELNVGVGTA